MSEWTDTIAIAQGTVGVVLNTLAWLVILRTKSLHNMTNYLLVYLAVVDSIYSCNIIFVHATTGNHQPEGFIDGEIFCWIVRSGFANILTAYLSSYGLCLVTYERYIGIVRPLHYQRLMSAKKVKLIIFISWMMSVIFTSPLLFTTAVDNDINEACDHKIDSLLSQLGTTHAVIYSYLLAILFMSWAYYKIQATLKRSAQQLQQQNAQGAALELLQARQNVISTLKIVIGALVVLWTPYMIFAIVLSLTGVVHSDQGATAFYFLCAII